MTWFSQNTNATREAILEKLGSNYFEQGWIDSLKFLTFVSDLEAQFGVRFSNDEFQNQDFCTIQGLAQLVQRLSNKMASAEAT